MAKYDDIVGWFYRNGKRIPIRGKKGEKGYQGKNTKEVLDKVKADRGLEVDSADKRYMTENPRAINGDRVDLIGKNKKMSATFNSYSDGGKELINFRREPDKDMLRKKASKSQDKYITDKTGTNGYKYKSVDYDTSGGHVHKDVETKEEARRFLRRNNVLKVKQRMKQPELNSGFLVAQHNGNARGFDPRYIGSIPIAAANEETPLKKLIRETLIKLMTGRHPKN